LLLQFTTEAVDGSGFESLSSGVAKATVEPTAAIASRLPDFLHTTADP